MKIELVCMENAKSVIVDLLHPGDKYNHVFMRPENRTPSNNLIIGAPLMSDVYEKTLNITMRGVTAKDTWLEFLELAMGKEISISRYEESELLYRGVLLDASNTTNTKFKDCWWESTLNVLVTYEVVDV